MQAYNPLLLLVSVPIACGVLCLFLKDALRQVIRMLSLMVTASSFALTGYIFIRKPVSWQVNSSVVFTADNLSGFIALAVGMFAFLVSIYSIGFIKRSIGRYFGYFLMSLGGSFAICFADNFILLLVFWGFLAAMLYLMVNMQGTSESALAAKRALIIIGSTDALMIFGIGLLWSLSGTFSMSMMHIRLDSWYSYMAFAMLVSASFAKAGVMPFHSWLPDVAEHAPTSVTAYLPASLDKLLGIYLLARISLDLFIPNIFTNTALMLIGAVTLIFAVIMALVQTNFKRLLGYHAVSQIGYVVLGIGTGNPIGIAGGLFHMFNHAIYKSCLFMSGGNVERRCGTADLSRLGGVAKYMPVTFITFVMASLSICGIPPFNGFVSKWMIYQSVIETATPKNFLWALLLLCAMFGSVFTIANSMRLIHAIFLGRASSGIKGMKEASVFMAFPVSVLALLCLLLGLFAFVFPLPVFIAPIIKAPVAYIGSWSPFVAFGALAIAILIGLVSYNVLRSAKFRSVGSFVGGEDPDSMERISGVDFYSTISDLKPFKAAYKKEASGEFDIYYIVKRIVGFFTKFFQFLHNGILPTYMVWCLLGMAAIFLFLFYR